MAKALASCHKPIYINFAAKFGIEIKSTPATPTNTAIAQSREKLTTHKLAAKLGLKTKDFEGKLLEAGYLYNNGGQLHLTDLAKAQGIEFARCRYGYYFLFPAGFRL